MCSCVVEELQGKTYTGIKCEIEPGSPAFAHTSSPAIADAASTCRYPRNVLKRGAIQKRGKSGVFFDRFAVRPSQLACACCSSTWQERSVCTVGHMAVVQVLVPQKLFLMRGKFSFFPSDAVSLAQCTPDFDVAGRTIFLLVRTGQRK